MTGTDLLYDTAARGAWVLVLARLPGLLPALAIGLVVGLLQAATSIQEATLSFIPKLIGVFVCLVLFGGVIGGLLADFLREAVGAIPLMAR
jgi:flagellar biosynthetic protein FliQ